MKSRFMGRLYRWVAIMAALLVALPPLPRRHIFIVNKPNPGPASIGSYWIAPSGTSYPLLVAGGAPANQTDTTSLADSLPTIIASARQVREDVGMDFVSAVDRKSLAMGMGQTWREVDLARITSQTVSQGTTLDNPQQLVDTLISVEPTLIGVHIILTPEVEHYVSRNVAAEWGTLMENANRRLIDRRGLDIYDGATVTGGGTGTTLNHGVVSAMVAQIEGDVDESALLNEEIFTFLHGFQIHDIRTEVTSGVGTYPLPVGITADTFADGNKVIKEIAGAQIRRDNNVRIDTTPDGHGGVHARSGIILVQVTGKQRLFTRMLENQAGANALWLYDWFGYLERSAGNLVKRLLTDATAPTTG